MKIAEFVKAENFALPAMALKALWEEKFREGAEGYDDPETLDLNLADWEEQMICYLDCYGEHFEAFRAKAPKMAQGPWLPIEDAPKDGTVVDLWLKKPWNERKADMVWYEPWGVWVPKAEVDFINDETDMFGTGSEVPSHFMFPPKGPVL